jgi:BclB C-terminal domain-containing protein
MIKKYLLGIAIGAVLLFSAQNSQAQGVALNTTGAAADTSAMLDVNSTTKGMLVPRMTNAQIGQIHLPATGLLVYQTDGTAGFYYNKGTTTSPSWATLTGAAGAASAGTIIPFASGLPISISTTVSGPGIGGLVGFGNSASTSSSGTSTIDLTGGPGVLQNFAFSMPRSGTITSISAYFSTTTALSLIGTTISISAQLYESTTPDNTFTAVPGAVVTLAPGLSGLIALGTISNGITTGLSIPVTAQTRLLLVYTATASGITTTNTINGYASGGLSIN